MMYAQNYTWRTKLGYGAIYFETKNTTLYVRAARATVDSDDDGIEDIFERLTGIIANL